VCGRVCCVYMFVCMCVCVCEREREIKKVLTKWEVYEWKKKDIKCHVKIKGVRQIKNKMGERKKKKERYKVRERERRCACARVCVCKWVNIECKWEDARGRNG